MSILQVLKRIKHLDRKIKKNASRIQKWCSHFDNEEPQYNVEKLIQSVNDMTDEKARLRHALHKTNILVPVEFQGTKMSIDRLILLLTFTLPAKIDTLKLLRRKERAYNSDEKLKVVMNYDPSERDKRIDTLENLMDIAEELLDNVNISSEVVM